MKTIVITGASGVVGSQALKQLLDRTDVDKVIALGRRPLTTTHAKLTSEVVDLRDVAAMEAVIPSGVTHAICGLGTTMRQAGSKEAFRAVDYESVVRFAEAARNRGAKAFGLVSAIGTSANSMFFYPRVKGEAENAVIAMGFPRAIILRPSFIDDEGLRRDHRPLEKVSLPIARFLFSVVGREGRYAPVKADVIARALLNLLIDAPEDGVRIVESEAIHTAGRA